MTRKLIFSATLATAAVFAVAGTALAQGPGRGMGGDRDRHPVFGIVLMVALAAAAIIGTWLVIRRNSSSAVAAAPAAAAPASPTVSAEAILADRLARSEISADDYRSTLAALRGAPAAPRVDGEAP